MLMASSPAALRRRASSAISDVLRQRGVRTPREPPAEACDHEAYPDRHRYLDPVPHRTQPAGHGLVLEHHLPSDIGEEAAAEPHDPRPAVHEPGEQTRAPDHDGQ